MWCVTFVTFVTFLGRMWRSRTRKYLFNLWRFLSHPSRKTSHFGTAGKKLFWTGRNVTIRLGLKNAFLFPSQISHISRKREAGRPFGLGPTLTVSKHVSPMPSRAPTAAAAGCAAGTPSTRGTLTTTTTPATVLDTAKTIWEAFSVWTYVPVWRSADRACWPWKGIDVTGCGGAQFNNIQWRNSAYFQAHVCKCACVGGLERVLLVQPWNRDMARLHQVGIWRHPPHFRRSVITLASPAVART